MTLISETNEILQELVVFDDLETSSIFGQNSMSILDIVEKLTTLQGLTKNFLGAYWKFEMNPLNS